MGSAHVSDEASRGGIGEESFRRADPLVSSEGCHPMSLSPYLADVVVLLGLAVMTMGTIGIITMPDIYTKLHAASKSVFLGVILISLATLMTHDLAFVLRVLVICGALVLTTPIASHVIGRAAYLEREHMETPGAVDESGQHLAEEEDTPTIPADGLARHEAPMDPGQEPV